MSTAVTERLNRVQPRRFVSRRFHKMGRQEVFSPEPAAFPGDNPIWGFQVGWSRRLVDVLRHRKKYFIRDWPRLAPCALWQARRATSSNPLQCEGARDR